MSSSAAAAIDSSTNTNGAMIGSSIGQGPLSPPPLMMISTTLYVISSIFTFIEFQNTNNPNAALANKESSQPDHESRGRRGGVRRNHMKQRGDSPVDLREGSPHTRPDPKANGEINRRLFYRYLLYSQLLRTCCLPLSYIFYEKYDLYQITSIVAQTLPTLSSVLAYSVLIIFYAQVAMTASGGSYALETLQTIIVKVAYAIYATLVGLNCVVPLLSGKYLYSILCGTLSLAFLLLFISMNYFGLKMIHLLKSTVSKMLGCRLVSMSTTCCIAFILRAIILGWQMYSSVAPVGYLLPSLPFGNDMLSRYTIGYLSLEWFPDVAVLILMHRKKPTPPENQDQSASNLEAGHGGYMSPIPDQQNAGHIQHQSHDGKKSEPIVSTGFARSHSANGGAAVGYSRPPFSQQGHSSRIIASSNVGNNLTASSRSLSGGGRAAETLSLLGDKSKSAVASTSNPSSLYGALNS